MPAASSRFNIAAHKVFSYILFQGLAFCSDFWPVLVVFRAVSRSQKLGTAVSIGQKAGTAVSRGKQDEKQCIGTNRGSG